MNLYSYEGPVMKFGICIAPLWKSATLASTENKARSNLTYQFKKSSGLASHAKITLLGKIILEERRFA